MTKKPRVTEQYALRHLKTPALFTKQNLEAWLSLRSSPKFVDIQDSESQELHFDFIEDYSQLWLQAAFWKAIHTYGAFILSVSAVIWASAVYALISVPIPYAVMVVLTLILTFVLYQFAAPFTVAINPSSALNRHAWNAVYDYLLAVEHAGHNVKDFESSVRYNKAVLRAIDFGVATGVITPSSLKETQ